MFIRYKAVSRGGCACAIRLWPARSASALFAINCQLEPANVVVKADILGVHLRIGDYYAVLF
jgi:hypothetical protein